MKDMKKKHSVSLPTEESKTGFTLMEAVFAALVLVLVILVPVGEARRQTAISSVEECQRNQARVAKRLWAEYNRTGQFPADASEILERTRGRDLSNDYEYEPLGANRSGYYLRCRHDHTKAAVLYVDSGAELSPRPIYSEETARGSMQ